MEGESPFVPPDEGTTPKATHKTPSGTGSERVFTVDPSGTTEATTSQKPATEAPPATPAEERLFAADSTGTVTEEPSTSNADSSSSTLEEDSTAPTTDTDPKATTSVTETAESAAAEKAVAERTAQRVINRKTAQIRKSVEGSSAKRKIEDLSPGERALYEAHLFEKGFSADDFKGSIPINETADGPAGYQVITTDGNEVTVTIIKKQDRDATSGKITYTCVDPAHPDETVEVPADQIVKAHLKSRHERIAQTFKTEGEKALVEWHAQGEEIPVPEIAKETIKTENDPIIQADRQLASYAEKLRAELVELRKSGDKDTIAQKELLLHQIEFADETKGELGVYAKMAALNRYAEAEQKNLAPEDAQVLAEVMNNLAPQATEAEKKLHTMLKQKGFSDQEIAEMQDKDIFALLSNSEFVTKLSQIEDIDTMLFGRNLTEDEMQTIVSKFLTPEQHSRFNELLKTGGKWSLIALLVAISVPLIAGTAVGLSAGPMVLKEMAK